MLYSILASRATFPHPINPRAVHAIDALIIKCTFVTLNGRCDTPGRDCGMADRTGQQLGNYRIVHLLGQGGFADVYLGEHIHLRTRAAIKVLQMRLAKNNAESFLQEARMVAHLIHPHIIRVLDFGVWETVPFLVMDYAPGGTLRQRYLRGIPLAPATLFPYVTQIASALQYA